MKAGIMQPYFFPYIGYWQLINAVDKYIIYDDVNYINRGWINRNRIIVDGQVKYFNLPLIGASQNKHINELKVSKNSGWILKKMKTIEYAYKKAPYFCEIFPLIKDILNCKNENLALYLENSFYLICNYLDIKTEFIISSSLDKDCNKRGQEKIISICDLLEITEYYNAIGGKELYSFSDFKERGITLKFLQTNEIEYKQFGKEFYPNLSILDVMMFNSKDRIKEMLNDYVLITNV